MTDRRRPVRVVVVDDSPTRRSALTAMLVGDGADIEAAHLKGARIEGARIEGARIDGARIEVVGTAADPASALRAVQLDEPDVVTMDMEMPHGGGVAAVEQIMATRPVPILVVSAHVRGAQSILAIDALAAGALDVFVWPDRWDAAAAAALRTRVKSIAGVTVVHHPRGARRRPGARSSGSPPPHSSAVVGIAASTGGPPALAVLLSDLRGLPAPILVVQHLHADFMDAFVAWMTRSAAVPVLLAVDGSEARPGVVHVAPPGRHLTITSSGTLRLAPQPARLHMPSADVLFESMAAAFGRAAVGVILTGMGEDGAEGLRAVYAAGGYTVGQDEATSVVWGMPQAASRRGGLTRLAPLEGIGALIRARCS